MAYVEVIRTAAGERFRGGYRANGRKYSQVFDYRYEAETWGTVEEAKAKARVAELTGNPAPAPALNPSNIPNPAAAPTLLAHATEWIERRSGALAKATLNNYRHHARALALEGLALPMDTIARSDIQRWQTAAAKVKGPVVLNQRLKFIRSLYRDAMAELPGVIVHDPTHGVRPLPVADPPDRNLTADEADALLAAAAADPTTHLPILVALDAGLRWSEVFGLTPAAILSDRFLSVHQVVERDASRIRPYTKGHRSRPVPMPPRLSAALVPYAEAVAKFRGRDALLFPGKDGVGPVVYWTWTRNQYRPAVEAAGILPAGFHALRHTYGSKLAAAGVPRVEIAKVMGHADEETTARYMHAGDDGRRYDLVAAALAG